MLEEKLNELNIFALRDLARRTGVSSPTSKKKDELIRGVMEIMSGEKSPEVNKTKQGRPPKAFGYDFANVLTSNQNLSYISLNQNVINYEADDIKTVAGTLELVNGNAAILWVEKNLNNENYFVSSNILKGYDLRTGDRVVAEVCVDDNQQVVKNLFSINDCPITQFSNVRKNYIDVQHQLPSRCLSFNNDTYANLKLKMGENCYIYGDNNNVNTTKIIELMNSCNVENKIYINISLAEKNKIFLSNINASEKFVANLVDDSLISQRIVNIAVERAKRILENGEDVLVVVDDISSIIGLGKEGENLVKNLVSSAKETGASGSITLLAVMPCNGFNQIEKLADVRLNICNDLISKI